MKELGLKTHDFMISLDANIRNTKTKGELSLLRNSGNVPAVIYGGEAQNETISVSKKILKSLIEKQNFLSNIVTLKVMVSRKMFFQEKLSIILFLMNQFMLTF